MGEVLKEMPKNGGGNPKLTSVAMKEVGTIPQLGISHSMSSRCQAIAAVPEAEFEAAISKAVEKRQEVTSGEMCKKGRWKNGLA